MHIMRGERFRHANGRGLRGRNVEAVRPNRARCSFSSRRIYFDIKQNDEHGVHNNKSIEGDTNLLFSAVHNVKNV